MTRRPGALAALAGCLLPVAGAVGVDTTGRGLVVLGSQLVLLGPFATQLRSIALRSAFVVFAGSSIAVSTYLYGGHHIDTAVGAIVRVLCIATPSMLLTGWVRPSDLGDQLAQRIRLPARLVVASTAALQRVDGLGEQWGQIQVARRARGLGVDGGPIRRVRSLAGSAFTLLVVALRQSGVLATAMDARGFAGAHDRTWAELAPWRAVDSVVVGLGLLLAVGPWAIRVSGRFG
jgi:energy-coupling factor transporter transmembrane protein EcfT